MREFVVKKRKPDLVISLSGEIDSGNADEFYEQFNQSYSAPANVVFECAELTFIDSTTLGTFVKILKRVKTEGHSMKLTGLQPRIKKLFLICSLDSIMEISE